MTVVYDIRQQIPQFKDNHFPPYRYEPYPRMLVNKETGKAYKNKLNKEVIVHSEEEEKEFFASLSEETPKAISKIAKIEVDQKPEETLVRLQSATTVIETSEVEPVVKRRGRPPSLPKDLK